MIGTEGYCPEIINYRQMGADHVSYRDTYQQWVDEPTLDPELKADLKNMADDETTKEEAFAALWRLARQACVVFLVPGLVG